MCKEIVSNVETDNYITLFFECQKHYVHHTSHIQTQFCQESYGRKLKKSTWQSAKKLYTTLQICSFKNSFCKIANVLKEIGKKRNSYEKLIREKKLPLDGDNIVKVLIFAEFIHNSYT